MKYLKRLYDYLKLQLSYLQLFVCCDKLTDGPFDLTIEDIENLIKHNSSLWVALCKSFNPTLVWKSKKNSAGVEVPGMFLLGYRYKQGKQISYYISMDKWDETGYAQTRSKAPKWDGHTCQEVLQRLQEL